MNYSEDISTTNRKGMESMVEKLREYFRNTSPEQILKDWEETKEFDNIGPTMDQFLKPTGNEELDIREHTEQS